MQAPKPTKAAKILRTQAPPPTPSSSLNAASSSAAEAASEPACSAAAAASETYLAKFLDRRAAAIIIAKDNVALAAIRQLDARQKLTALEARPAQDSRTSDPAANKDGKAKGKGQGKSQAAQAAQIRSGLLAARRRELILATSASHREVDILHELTSQRDSFHEEGTLARCDNCCHVIHPAELQRCQPSPRSEALLHCPWCTTDPELQRQLREHSNQ